MSDPLFENTVVFPDPGALERYQSLFGLDPVKERLEKEAEILLRPELLEKWSKDMHGSKLAALDSLLRRPPLFIFAGDVGTGKTALATTFGDNLARSSGIQVDQFSLSLNTRGSGRVGEMTTLISDAFRFIRTKAHKFPDSGKKAKGATILFIDEADSLAQSRELAHMHHEDRTGVNALIRGIDDIAAAKLCCLVVMCTNRLGSVDPAVKRRAAAIFEFRRPNLEMRRHILKTQLAGTGLSSSDIEFLAKELGESASRPYGHTFSDIIQRYVPSVILAAYPKEKITHSLASKVLHETPPTPPFNEA